MENTRKSQLQATIGAMLENEAFSMALANCKTVEDTYNFLVNSNIDITLDEVGEFYNDGVAAMAAASSDELDENALENVAGGGWLRKAGRFVIVAAAGAALGFACGVCPLLTPSATSIAVGYSTVAAIWVSRG